MTDLSSINDAGGGAGVPSLSTTKFVQIAALAEVLLVLALGNILGVMIYESILPLDVVDGTASEELINFYAGVRIFLRIGLVAVFGFALLYYRRGMTPRAAGLTRAGKPLIELVKIGFLLGVFTTFLTAFLFGLNDIVRLGDGFAPWWTFSNRPINMALAIELIATSVIVPPLTEEIMARGYNRVRMVESFGVMGGVILAGFLFAISHTRYFQADGMLIGFALIMIISSISWTYLAQKTGSVIPSMVAHAMGNGIATWILFDIWVPTIIMTVLMVIFFKPVAAMIGEFVREWKADQRKSSLWFGLFLLIAMFVLTMALLPILGRVPTLASLGGIMLVITIANIVREKRTKR
jgi:membrane protease YdiL (CAAX protease family)